MGTLLHIYLHSSTLLHIYLHSSTLLHLLYFTYFTLPLHHYFTPYLYSTLPLHHYLSPHQPPKSPYPTNTVRQISTPRQKITYLPTNHPNHPIRPTQCGKSAPQGRKLPISPPTTQITLSDQHSQLHN